MLLKQSTAYTRLFFMVSSSDHLSAGTGAAPSVSISKAGAAFAAAAGAVTEISSGWYKIALTAADTGTLGDLAYHVTGTGVDPTDFVDQVGVRNTDDLAFPATSGRSLNVDATGRIDLGQWIGGTPDALSSGKLPADIKLWLTAAPNALNSGLVQADVERWANAVVNALIAGRVDANAQVVGDKTSYALSAAGVQAIWDALTTALTTAGSIGKRLADDIDATISSRASAAALTTVQADTDDIQTRLPAALVGGRMDASVGALGAGIAQAIADALLARSIAGGADGGRTVTSALRRVRNRLRIAAGTLTAYQEDDTTADHTAAVTTAAGDPITEIDPV